MINKHHKPKDYSKWTFVWFIQEQRDSFFTILEQGTVRLFSAIASLPLLGKIPSMKKTSTEEEVLRSKWDKSGAGDITGALNSAWVRPTLKCTDKFLCYLKQIEFSLLSPDIPTKKSIYP